MNTTDCVSHSAVVFVLVSPWGLIKFLEFELNLNGGTFFNELWMLSSYIENLVLSGFSPTIHRLLVSVLNG